VAHVASTEKTLTTFENVMSPPRFHPLPNFGELQFQQRSTLHNVQGGHAVVGCRGEGVAIGAIACTFYLTLSHCILHNHVLGLTINKLGHSLMMTLTEYMYVPIRYMIDHEMCISLVTPFSPMGPSLVIWDTSRQRVIHSMVTALVTCDSLPARGYPFHDERGHM
jgi:hypothetical protein